MSVVSIGVGGSPAFESKQPFYPPHISGCVLWLRSDKGVERDENDDVSAWRDQSGNNNDATQTTAAQRPTFNASSGPNNTPGLEFNGTTDNLALSITETSNDITCFAVIDESSVPVAGQALISSSGSGPDSHIYTAYPSGGDVYVSINDGTAWRFSSIAQTGGQSLEWHFNSGTTTFEGFRNGKSIGTDTYDGTLEISTTTKIGALYTLADHHFIGTISEIIVFNKVLSTAEIDSVRRYLSTRYSLPFLPTSIANNIIWLRSDVGITLSGSDVSDWEDQSGENNDFAQAVGSKQPAFDNTGSIPKLVFDGNDEHQLDGPNGNTVLGANPFALFAVCTLNPAGPDDNGIFGNNTAPGRFWLQQTYYGYDDTAKFVPEWAINNSLTVRFFGHDGADLFARENGVEVKRDTKALAALASNLLTVGKTRGSVFYSGDTYEIILYPRSLTDEEITSVEEYLTNRYGI
jgi:hypothetical protein